MGHDISSRRKLAQRAWEEHNLSQLRYFRTLSLQEKMADVLRRFEEMRGRGEFTTASLYRQAASGKRASGARTDSPL